MTEKEAKELARRAEEKSKAKEAIKVNLIGAIITNSYSGYADNDEAMEKLMNKSVRELDIIKVKGLIKEEIAKNGLVTNNQPGGNPLLNDRRDGVPQPPLMDWSQRRAEDNIHVHPDIIAREREPFPAPPADEPAPDAALIAHDDEDNADGPGAAPKMDWSQRRKDEGLE